MYLEQMQNNSQDNFYGVVDDDFLGSEDFTLKIVVWEEFNEFV